MALTTIVFSGMLSSLILGIFMGYQLGKSKRVTAREAAKALQQRRVYGKGNQTKKPWYNNKVTKPIRFNGDEVGERLSDRIKQAGDGSF